MRTLLAAIALSLFAGCGVETATTAATVAEAKRREMEQAKKSMEMAKQKIEAANEQVQQRLERASEAAKD
jgi:cellobiose-specific phosphotransferase system component IIA